MVNPEDEADDEGKSVFYVREFLNLPRKHSTGLILADVTRDSYGSSAELTISDCSRTINLSIDLYDGHRENTLYKLDLLVNTITDFRAAVVAEMEVVKVREAERKAKREQERLIPTNRDVEPELIRRPE